MTGRHSGTSDPADVRKQCLLSRGRPDQLDLARGRLDTKIELALPAIAQQQPRPLQQNPELGIGMSRAHVRNDPPTPMDVLSDLHGRRTRGRPHPPYPRHTPTLGHSLVPQTDP